MFTQSSKQAEPIAPSDFSEWLASSLSTLDVDQHLYVLVPCVFATAVTIVSVIKRREGAYCLAAALIASIVAVVLGGA